MRMERGNQSQSQKQTPGHVEASLLYTVYPDQNPVPSTPSDEHSFVMTENEE